MAKKQIELIVKNYINSLKSMNLRIEKAILFGSCARGNNHRDSDIDIAIISPDLGKDYIEEAVMLKEIGENLHLDISPRPYSVDEYNNAKRGQFLYDAIIGKGRFIDV
jgi:predicted nucleotidyltransferase